MDVLVAVAPKAIVDAYWRFFLAANLKPVAFEIDALAIARSAIAENQTRAVMVMDVGHQRCTFCIRADKVVHFTASMAIADGEFSEAAAKQIAKTLGKEAKQYVDFFRTHASHIHLTQSEVAEILVCGDGAQLPGFVAALTQEIGLPVLPANPWVNILRPPLREVPMLAYKDSQGYAVVLGLALRGYHEFAN